MSFGGLQIANASMWGGGGGVEKPRVPAWGILVAKDPGFTSGIGTSASGL